MKIKLKLLAWFFMGVMLLVLLTGCGLVRRPVPPTPETPPQQPNYPNQPPQAPQQGQIENQLIDEINASAESVTGVIDASTIVLGNTAMIGLTMQEGVDAQTTKDRVTDQVEELPEIEEALVTSDPELVRRIQDATAKLEAGRPTDEVFEEIMEIWERLRPQR